MTDFNTILARLRLLLNDSGKQVWEDQRLLDYLCEGQDEYIRRTGILKKSFQACPDSDGYYRFPPNYIDMFFGMNDNGAAISQTTEDRLLEIYGGDLSDVGSPEYIYELGGGKFGLYPVPAQEETLVEGDSDFGLIEAVAEFTGGADEGSGFVFIDDGGLDIIISEPSLELDGEWGLLAAIDDWFFESEYGTIDELTDFIPAAEIYYNRRPDYGVWNADDGLAVVFYAAARAYEEQTDRHNPQFATGLQLLFNIRVGGTKARRDKINRRLTDNERWM